jgi:hypothetical protein
MAIEKCFDCCSNFLGVSLKGKVTCVVETDLSMGIVAFESLNPGW